MDPDNVETIDIIGLAFGVLLLLFGVTGVTLILCSCCQKRYRKRKKEQEEIIEETKLQENPDIFCEILCTMKEENMKRNIQRDNM